MTVASGARAPAAEDTAGKRTAAAGGWGLGSLASASASIGKRLLDALPDD